MSQKWVQETAFPIIAEAIERLHSEPGHFVTHREIVRFLLRQSHTRKLIEVRYKQLEVKESIEEYAGSMVAWFSQKWTMGDKKWFSLFSRFERSENKIDNCYAYRPRAAGTIVVFADDVEEDSDKLPEGAAYQRLVNGYERNPLARQRCIQKYGTNCFVCGFSFGATYGKAVDGFIHVHHLLQLSRIRKEYKIDPLRDLRPVCPNCHAVIHSRQNEPYTIAEVQAFLERQRTS